MEGSISGAIFDRFLADLLTHLPWGPQVVDRLRDLQKMGDFRPETILAQAFQSVVTDDAGAEE